MDPANTSGRIKTGIFHLSPLVILNVMDMVSMLVRSAVVFTIILLLVSLYLGHG